MGNDLNAMALSDLKKLRANVDKAISLAEVKRKKEARAAVQKIAKEYGVSVVDLLDDEHEKPKRTKKAATKKSHGKPKYRNPSDPSQTWTGKGRRPRWYIDAVDAGKTEADLLA